jgi:phage antirepressor YoqD-like protein
MQEKARLEPGPKPKVDYARVFALRDGGMKVDDIAKEVDLTSRRVQQILARPRPAEDENN